MRRLMRWLTWGFGAVYLAALSIFLISYFGMFGAQPDPLAGLFLVPLGLPWSLLTGWLPLPLQPYAVIATPLINVAILGWAAGLRRA